jgi:methylated-DNA-[protein]-cysteine S-methyltransferase
MTPMNYTYFDSQFGWVGVAKSDRGIARVTFGAPTDAAITDRLLNGSHRKRGLHSLAHNPLDPELLRAEELLGKYFDGVPVYFDIELDLGAGTPFQRCVWETALRIPYGQVQSYGWIAREIGNPNAMRAVGGAMAANPLAIIVPCHRVVRSDGGLGGYGGGLHWKQKLLAMEQRT